MADSGRLVEFRRAAEAAHPDDPQRVARLIEMESRFLDGHFGTDLDQDFQLLNRLFGDRSINDLMEWTALRSRETVASLPGALHHAGQSNISARLASGVMGTPSDVEHLRLVHNERVKLNANLFNTLAGWALGAGGVGIAANSVLGSAPHRWLVSVGILASGLLFGGLLKWTANREVGKLR